MEVDALKGLIAKKDAIEAGISSLDVRLIVFGAIVLIGIAGETWYGVRTWWGKERDRIESEKDRQATAISDQLKLEIADANKATEEIRNENLKLQEKLAPRFITPEQQSGLRAELSKLGPRDLDVITCGDSPEIFRFEQLLISPIKLAGWNVRVWTVVGGGIYATGISIENRPGTDSTAADGLMTAFKSQGIAASRVEFSRWDKLPCVLTGPDWDQNKIAQTRMWIGTKQ
jgi:hypothetical protein